MNASSPPSPERSVRCWCGNARLEDFSPDYFRCAECETLVLREMRGEEISQVRNDDQDFYGKNYYLHHVQEDYGLPDLETRARADLPERCLHWLRTLLKFVPGPGARTLELGCGHGGFVAMQRWAGLDATGLELSPWLVDKAHEWFGVPVLAGRLEDQQLAPASFDVVALMDVLEHLPDPRRTIGQAVALLRSPESFLLIQTPCYRVGWSYEKLLAENHPFLIQLKPAEHLFLFSQQAVARLCSELGVGQVRFEPAIFAHYDQFAVASAGPLRERTLPQRTEMLMAASPPARWTLALLDLDQVRDDLTGRLAAAAADGAALHTAINALWPRLDAAENARNLLAAQLEDLRGQFERGEADRLARLQVIEAQGSELARLHAGSDQLWRQLDTAHHAHNLLAAQLADLQRQFAAVAADGSARLEVIERQGNELGELRAQLAHTGGELSALRGHYRTSEADRAARLKVIEEQGRELGELSALRGHLLDSEADRAARLQVIEEQGRELGELRAQLSSAHGELSALHGHYRASEADRTARLKVIEEQGTHLVWLQSRLDASEGQSAQLGADLATAREAHAGLVDERSRLAADVDTMNAAHADLAAEHSALRARHKTLNQHWTTWVLKRLRLWPL